jgi:hypothetical protein
MVYKLALNSLKERANTLFLVPFFFSSLSRTFPGWMPVYFFSIDSILRYKQMCLLFFKNFSLKYLRIEYDFEAL